ncbi:hypothetical protein [Rhodococcus sp. MEB064]|uniref:hypothetical protein n=1 Tax=Rhodococcus sp. MEB064 TaxID=1587522 RepID=UPI00069634DE|nr:hypothetical protein [Rhodococcus sp. MEB064]
MTEPGSVVDARAQFNEALDALAATNKDAALVVLTMARLAAHAMLAGDAALTVAASRVINTEAKVPTRPAVATPTTTATTRSRTSRAAAELDPFQVYRTDGREGLQSGLAALDLEQLRDIIHQFGMDPDKRAMKWKTISKVRERIVERTESTRNRDRAFH